MVGLVPTIQLSANSDACWTLDPRDKPEDDTSIFCWCQNRSGATGDKPRYDSGVRQLSRAASAGMKGNMKLVIVGHEVCQ